MPTRRSSARSQSKDKGENQNEKCNAVSQKEKQSWVVFGSDEVFQNSESPELCKLKHPKTEKGALFFFPKKDGDVYELQMFDESFRSWLIDDLVHKDLFTTPIDPLFLVLPYLQKTSQSGKYMTLDQIVKDDEYIECSRLCSTSGMSALPEVSDVKGDDSFTAYRFNKEKTLLWLKQKTERLIGQIMVKNINVCGSQNVNYVLSKKASVASKEDYERFAFGIISDYLSEELSTAFREFMGIPLIVPKKERENEEPPAKRQKTENMAPTDDYSAGQQKLKAKDEIKLSSAHKKLSQVDKTGMKSISSFFSRK